MTGWEQRGGASWTTLAEEESFLLDVEAASPRVRVKRVATTLGERAVWLVVVGGDEGPPPLTDISNQPLILCGVHGSEVAPREAALMALRDLALDMSPGTSERLAESPVVFIPNLNPDGRAANTRHSSAGWDLNRCHITLQSPENWAVNLVVEATDPAIIYDGHEWGGASLDFYVKNYEPNALMPLKLWGDEFYQNDLPGIMSGYSHGRYPDIIEVGTITSTYPARGFPVVLGESNYNANASLRVAVHHRLIMSLCEYAHVNKVALTTVKAEARSLALTAVAPRQALSGTTVTSPRGYIAPADQAARLIHGFGFEFFELDDRQGQVFIPMNQPLSGLIPYLFDPAYAHYHTETTLPQIVTGEPTWEHASPRGLGKRAGLLSFEDVAVAAYVNTGDGKKLVWV